MCVHVTSCGGRRTTQKAAAAPLWGNRRHEMSNSERLHKICIGTLVGLTRCTPERAAEAIAVAEGDIDSAEKLIKRGGDSDLRTLVETNQLIRPDTTPMPTKREGESDVEFLVRTCGLLPEGARILLTDVGGDVGLLYESLKNPITNDTGAAFSIAKLDLGDVEDARLVMAQAGVDRATAIRALERNGGDIVDAIMDLMEIPSRGDEIELLVTDLGVSREAAARALKRTNGNLTQAILDLEEPAISGSVLDVD